MGIILKFFMIKMLKKPIFFARNRLYESILVI